RAERLVADDVNAGPEKRGGDRRMQMIRGHDRHRFDAVLARGLARGHCGEVVVGAIPVEPKLQSRRDRAARLGRQGPGHEHVLVVEPCGDAVHRADEGALPAPHHAQADATIGRGRAAPFDHGAFPSRPSRRRFAAWSTPLPAKSSNARSVTRMMWSRMKAAPSRAPSSGCFRQHSHSSTAQPAYPYWVSFEKMPRKSTWPSPSERNRPARLTHD